ncbi:MAG: hypothetical protein ACW99J_16450 [Candidatus Thorarchaeota archaeon]
MMHHTTMNIPVVVLLLLTAMSLQPSVIALEDEVVVLRIINRHVFMNQTYRRPVVLMPYSPHSIESEIHPLFPTISDTILIVELDSEMNGGIGFLHDGADRHHNTTFTPSTTDYEIEVTNTGYVDEIVFNLTITQTGFPSTPEPTFPVESLGLLVFLSSVAVLVLLVSGFLILRHEKKTLQKVG